MPPAPSSDRSPRATRRHFNPRIHRMQIGFLGLGAMGSAMAGNIAAAGHEVRGWSRAGRPVDGVKLMGSPGEVFDADAVVTMLPDEETIGGDTGAGPARSGATGLVHVVCSTISVDFARERPPRTRRPASGMCRRPFWGDRTRRRGASCTSWQPGRPWRSSGCGRSSRLSVSACGPSATSRPPRTPPRSPAT